MDQAPLSVVQNARRLLELPIDASLALVFPGQGSQRTGMGSKVRAASACARAVFQAADDDLGFSISDLCKNGPDDALTETVNAQPAILTTSLAVLAAALETGTLPRRPAYVAGHSLGQYTALVVAGSLTPDTAVRLVRERGLLMAEASAQRKGTLAAIVGLDELAVEQVCREAGAEIANYNAPTQTVIGGPPAAVERACVLAKERGGRGIPVNVSGAFHTSLMESAAVAFAHSLEAAQVRSPEIPVVGNRSAHVLTTGDDVLADLREQVRAPVRWYQSMDLLEETGVREVIEIGPGRILTTQLKRSNPNLLAGSLDEAQALGITASV